MNLIVGFMFLMLKTLLFSYGCFNAFNSEGKHKNKVCSNCLTFIYIFIINSHRESSIESRRSRFSPDNGRKSEQLLPHSRHLLQ